VSTQINIVVGGSTGLREQDRQRRSANRQGQLDQDRTTSIETEATRKRSQNLETRGLDPQGRSLYAANSSRSDIARPPAASRTAGEYYFIAHGNWSKFAQDSFVFNYDTLPLLGEASGEPGYCTIYTWGAIKPDLSRALVAWFNRAFYGVNKATNLVISNSYKQVGLRPTKIEIVGTDYPRLEYLPTTLFATDSDSFLIFGYKKSSKIYCYINTRVIWRGGGSPIPQDRQRDIRWDFIEETPDYELKNQPL